MNREAQRKLDGPPVDVAGDVAARAAHVTVPPSGVNLGLIELAIIRFALAQHGGNQTHAAQFLHLSRSALLYRMQKYGLAGPHREAARQAAAAPGNDERPAEGNLR